MLTAENYLGNLGHKCWHGQDKSHRWIQIGLQLGSIGYNQGLETYGNIAFEQGQIKAAVFKDPTTTIT